MKICRYDGGHVGIVDGDAVLDVTSAIGPIVASFDRLTGDPLVRALGRISQELPALVRGASRVALSGVNLDAPVARPTKIVAAPVNYRAHVAEANADPGIRYGHTQTDIGEAGLFLKATSSLAGPGAGIPLRFPDRRTDYEAELVVVIGREGSDIPLSQALSFVAGYSVGLDITLRGPEDRSFRKSIDGYSVVGPWLTTADEIPNPDTLALSLRLNGEQKQCAETSSMVYSVGKLISFASSFYTLYPGDILFTGTPEGVGPLRPGDRLVATVTGLGRLETTVGLHGRSGQTGGEI